MHNIHICEKNRKHKYTSILKKTSILFMQIKKNPKHTYDFFGKEMFILYAERAC